MDDSLAAKIASVGPAASDRETPGESWIGPDVNAADDSPFAFLSAATPTVLGDLLADEHAQTISLVLSHLPANKVTEALQQLKADQRREVIERLGRLQATDESVVIEIAQQLQRQFQRRIRETARAASASSPSHVSPKPGRPSTALRPHGAGTPARASANELVKPAPPRTRWSDFEFDDLGALADHALAIVFQRAEPRVALIALTGASPSLIDRIRRQLPWREARELRRQIERLGPIRLSDVEHAQRKLAETAAALIQDGIIAPPANRRFTSAA
jgi:flagellar motor switch protein FliG